MSSLDVMNAINYSTANAGGFVNLAKTALASATAAVTGVGYDSVTWQPIALAVPPLRENIPTAPTITPPTLNLPSDPANPPPVVFPASIDAGPAPVNRARAPTINLPNVPAQLGAAPLPPLINTSFVFPEPPAALSNTLPTAPVFGVRAEPTAPQIILPEFREALPERVADAPTNGTQIMDAAYTMQSLRSQKNADAYVDAMLLKVNPRYQEQMGRIETQLARYLEGGTALAPAVENAIYERAKGKNDAEARRVRDSAFSDAANRGFTMPSGALMSAVMQARQAGADNNARAASEIVVMQAEMEQKNLQFAVTTSASLRASMVSASLSYMQHVVSMNGQAMDYAKSVFPNIVELYNASVRVYSARVDAYKSYAAVYETQMKAATVKIDIYRAEIAALEAMNNVDQARVATFKAQIDAVSSLVGLYRAQIEAVQGRASLEKIKLDIFQSQTQLYSAQVQARNAEWGGYSAQLSGEETKMKIYGAELQAFNSEIDAYKTVISAKAADVSAITATNQANASVYSASVQGFSAKVSAESERSRAHNENNKAVLNTFDKEITAFMARTNLMLAQYKVENDAKVQNATSNLSAQIEQARARTQYGATLAQLSNDGAQIYGQLAGSAMAGLNTLVASVANE